MAPLLDSRPAASCNIGPAEIARRRRFAILASVATAALAVALVWLAVPHPARAVLLPIAAGAAVAWLQVTERFCVRFGATGVENFGPLGGEHRVADGQADADRRRAGRLIAEGLLAALIATLAFVLLPI